MCKAGVTLTLSTTSRRENKCLNTSSFVITVYISLRFDCSDSKGWSAVLVLLFAVLRLCFTSFVRILWSMNVSFNLT